MTNRLLQPLTKTAALLVVAVFMALPQGMLAQPDDWDAVGLHPHRHTLLQTNLALAVTPR